MYIGAPTSHNRIAFLRLLSDGSVIPPFPSIPGPPPWPQASRGRSRCRPRCQHPTSSGRGSTHGTRSCHRALVLALEDLRVNSERWVLHALFENRCTWQDGGAKLPNILWVDEILHHVETTGNHCLLVFTGQSSFQGFYGGAGFCSSTVGNFGLWQAGEYDVQFKMVSPRHF